MLDLAAAVPELTSRVDAELRDIVGSRDLPLYDMMSYHMGWTDGQGRADGHPLEGALTVCSACWRPKPQAATWTPLSRPPPRLSSSRTSARYTTMCRRKSRALRP